MAGAYGVPPVRWIPQDLLIVTHRQLKPVAVDLPSQRRLESQIASLQQCPQRIDTGLGGRVGVLGRASVHAKEMAESGVEKGIKPGGLVPVDQSNVPLS